MKITDTNYNEVLHEQSLIQRLAELESKFMNGRDPSNTLTDDVMDVEYLMLVAELVGLRRRINAIQEINMSAKYIKRS